MRDQGLAFWNAMLERRAVKRETSHPIPLLLTVMLASTGAANHRGQAASTAPLSA